MPVTGSIRRCDFQLMKTNLNSENYRKTANKLKLLSFQAVPQKKNGEAGFSLIEVSIAMVVFLIAVLGVFISFAYAINYNSGNSSRAQALALLQQKVEQMRSLTFVPTMTDDALTGGEKDPDIVTAPDGNPYRLKVIVDDDPFTEVIDIDPTTTFKEVSVTVSLEAPTPGWQTSVPATVILRRVRGN
jgi:prepilin-type N-terminal cleavage/methylation domain-containing protein